MTFPADPPKLRVALHGSFPRYWWSRFLSALAMQMQTTAVGWHVYELARSRGASIEEGAFLLGLLGLTQLVSLLGFSFIGGDMADRHSPHRVLITAYFFRSGCVALLLVTPFIENSLATICLFSATLATGVANAFIPAANATLLAQLRPRAGVSRAVAAVGLGVQGGAVAGPLIGGILCMVSPMVAYFGCVAFNVAALVCVRLTGESGPPWAPVTAKGVGALAASAEALAFIWKSKILFGVMSLDLAVGVLAGSVALLPAIARDLLMLGPGELGLLRACMAGGAVLSALYFWSRPLERHVGRWLFASTFIYGAATIGFGMSSVIVPAAVCLVIVGAAEMVSVFIRQSIVQLDAPPAMRGRLGAFAFVSRNTSIELGNFEAGVVSRLIGPSLAVMVGGAAAMVVGGAWMAMFGNLRRKNSFHDD